MSKDVPSGANGITKKLMAISILNLAAGQLVAAPSTPAGVIYSGSTSKATIVKGIVLTNRGVGTEAVNIYLKPGSSGPLSASSPAYLISPKDMKVPPSGQVVLDLEVTLATGVNALTTYPDQLLGTTSTAATVDYVINGMQRDL